VAVEVLGEDGKPLAGYEAAACKPIRSDTLAAEGDGWVRWASKADLKAVQGITVKLRFVLQDADLFSFRVADERTKTLPGPRATTK
jgi:hypothetical protein